MAMQGTTDKGIAPLCAGLLLMPSGGSRHDQAAEEAALLPASAGLAAFLLEDDWLLQFAASQLSTPTAATGAASEAAQVRKHAGPVTVRLCVIRTTGGLAHRTSLTSRADLCLACWRRPNLRLLQGCGVPRAAVHARWRRACRACEAPVRSIHSAASCKQDRHHGSCCMHAMHGGCKMFGWSSSQIRSGMLLPLMGTTILQLSPVYVRRHGTLRHS